MKAEIITIGDEILIGQIVDTNSAWIAKELNKTGIEVERIHSISDRKEEIVSALDQGLESVDLILFTGGLGPTNDDITKKCLSDYFGMNLVRDQHIYQKIEKRLADLNIPMNEFNTEQALVPDGATIFQNDFGTAPCMWFEKEGKVVVSMPGVPYEMKGLMENHILSALQKHFKTEAIVHQTVMTHGIGESVLAEMLQDWEANLPTQIKLAYLPNAGQVRLRLSTKGKDEQQLKQDLQKQVDLLHQIIPNNIFSLEDQPMEMAVAEILVRNNWTMGTAESCTGGYIAHLITSHAGSSAYFKGSVVSYANEVKQNVLKVDPKDLEQHGAVSQPVVEQMAKGAREVLGVDVAIATSGVAGPDGGTEEKPVGTVWIAMASKDHVVSECLHLYKLRERNIRVAALKALNLLRVELSKLEG